MNMILNYQHGYLGLQYGVFHEHKQLLPKKTALVLLCQLYFIGKGTHSGDQHV
jgi:hypothetical protein